MSPCSCLKLWIELVSRCRSLESSALVGKRVLVLVLVLASVLALFFCCGIDCYGNSWFTHCLRMESERRTWRRNRVSVLWRREACGESIERFVEREQVWLRYNFLTWRIRVLWVRCLEVLGSMINQCFLCLSFFFVWVDDNPISNLQFGIEQYARVSPWM